MQRSADLFAYDDVLEGKNRWLVDMYATNQIRAISLLYGNAIRPNYINKVVDGKFLDPVDIFSYIPNWETFAGYSAWGPFVNSAIPAALQAATPDCNDKTRTARGTEWCALLYAPISSSLSFAESNSFFKFTTWTQGLFCPLLPYYTRADGSIDDSCYDAKGEWTAAGGSNCQRSDGAPQFYTPRKLSIAQQAMNCLGYALRPSVELNGGTSS